MQTYHRGVGTAAPALVLALASLLGLAAGGWAALAPLPQLPKERVIVIPKGARARIWQAVVADRAPPRLAAGRVSV